MKVTMNDLTVNFSHLDRDTLLEDWRWLIGPSKLPILLTASGNAFVQDADDETVHFLRIGTAELLPIAENEDAFRALLGDDAFVTNYLAVQMVGAMMQKGTRLGPGQIYSFKILPTLGGQYALENVEATDISVHFSLSGQMQQKISALPPGTVIDSFSIS